MHTLQTLTFQENFRFRIWATHTFPAGTPTKEIASTLHRYRPDNRLQTALKRKKARYQEWEIIPENPDMAYV